MYSNYNVWDVLYQSVEGFMRYEISASVLDRMQTKKCNNKKKPLAPSHFCPTKYLSIRDCIIKRNHLNISIFHFLSICPDGSVLIPHWIWVYFSFADIFTVGSLQRLHPQTQDNNQVHLSILYILLSMYCICALCIYVFTFIFKSVYICTLCSV